MPAPYHVQPVGVIRKRRKTVTIEIQAPFKEAMAGLDQFSHIHVLYWFHQNDTPKDRSILKVHPCKNEKNPLTGVFATHSSVRPNPIALTLCKIVAIRDLAITIDDIDALDGSPVIDIKCYFPDRKYGGRVRVPDWELKQK